jgi:hypothetical protein
MTTDGKALQLLCSVQNKRQTEMRSAKTVLVTGAGRFIGHHLVKYLVGEGYFVRGADPKYPKPQLPENR